MDDSNRLTIIDENGQEKDMEIILTFDDDRHENSYVLFKDPMDETGTVYVYRYDEDNNLYEITDEETWQMCQEVLNAYLDQENADEPEKA